MPIPQSVGRLVCQFIAQMSKPRKTANPGVNLYSCHLLTFIHFHQPLFIINFHPFMQAFIKKYIHQNCSFIHS